MAYDLQKKLEYARQIRKAQSKFRRIHSLDLIPEQPSQENTEDEATDVTTANTTPCSSAGNSRCNSSTQLHLHKAYKNAATTKTTRTKQTTSKYIQSLVLFWPNLLCTFLLSLLRYILFVPLSIAAPSFWLSAILWMFWKLVRVPIAFVKWLTNSDTLSTAKSTNALPTRTVLISSGSSIQTLHLARNLYSSGLRVIVFEFDGLFGLSRFSTAVDKFYVVPRPSTNNVDSYITALCHIIRKENVKVYIPVCANSAAYFDALAKPHLELLGCACFIPGLAETIALDDCLRFYQKCTAAHVATPPYSILSSLPDLWHLYETGFISGFRNILMACGMQGLLERYKYVLPCIRRDFKFQHEISEQQQWLVVQDQPGYHYITCTTVKESRVAANVSCKVDRETKNLMPIVGGVDSEHNGSGTEAEQIERWLHMFFAKARFQRPINGHISFRLVKCQRTGEFLPLGVRIGVSLPYICYNRSHVQILYRNIKSMQSKPFGLLDCADLDEGSALSGLGNKLSWAKFDKTTVATALDRRDVLFAYWDPLPYCAYHHFQFPLESVKVFLQKRSSKSKTKTMTYHTKPAVAVPCK